MSRSSKLAGPERFRRALASLGISAEVRELPASTRTARDAAAALGCSEAEIAKSLIFRGRSSGSAVLAIMSGTNRADVAKLEAVAGEGLAKADADFVRRQTGFAIGGVPPFGFSQPIRAYLDQDLFRYQTVWAAAGGPSAIFETTPGALEAASGAVRSDLAESRQERPVD